MTRRYVDNNHSWSTQEREDGFGYLRDLMPKDGSVEFANKAFYSRAPIYNDFLQVDADTLLLKYPLRSYAEEVEDSHEEIPQAEFYRQPPRGGCPKYTAPQAKSRARPASSESTLATLPASTDVAVKEEDQTSSSDEDATRSLKRQLAEMADRKDFYKKQVAILMKAEKARKAAKAKKRQLIHSLVSSSDSEESGKRQ
ncbi:unnamed protein product, partial [Durusdinium trenchii]